MGRGKRGGCPAAQGLPSLRALPVCLLCWRRNYFFSIASQKTKCTRTWDFAQGPRLILRPLPAPLLGTCTQLCKGGRMWSNRVDSTESHFSVETL